MVEEKDLYYKLFISLSSTQKKNVFKLWMDNIEEDIFIRKQLIKKYCDNDKCDNDKCDNDKCDNDKCDNDKCDFMMALFYIYDNIKGKYLCNYNIEKYETEYKYFNYNNLSSFLKNRIAQYLNSGRSLNEEQKNNYTEMLDIIEKKGEYNLSIANKNGFFYFIDLDIESISRNKVEDDEKDLYAQINVLSSERQKKPEEFINNPLNVAIEISDFEFYYDIEKNMYYKKPNSKESYNLYLQNEERKLLNPITLKHILKLCSKITDLSTEYYNDFITNLTKDYSIVLMNSIIEETKIHIKDRIIDYITINIGDNQEKNDLFIQDFDKEFEDAMNVYFEKEFFDNDNLKLKKHFQKDEFRQLKFILNRLREIRDEKDGVKEKERTALSNDSTNQNNLNQLQINKEYTKEKETDFTSVNNTNELKDIFEKSVTKGFFKDDTRLVDFLYVFGGGEMPEDFKKLVWIKEGKNREINKKLLIAFCMRILNLEPNDVGKIFYEWANDRFESKAPFNNNNKPSINYDATSLDILFLNIVTK